MTAAASTPSQTTAPATESEAPRAIVTLRELVAQEALAATAQAAYSWDIADGSMVWSHNAAALLKASEADIASSRLFSRLLCADTKVTRDNAVLSSSVRDGGDGVPYCVSYRMAQGNVLFEDRGRWFGDETGRPVRAVGTMRRCEDVRATDPLTGAAQRAELDTVLERAIRSSRRADEANAFVMLVLDGVDALNADAGHDEGDRTIVRAARRLARVMRTEDLMARFSGAQFGLVLRDCDEPELRIAAHRFALAVSGEHSLPVKPRMACLSLSGAMHEPRDVYRAAARALREAQHDPVVGCSVAFG